MALRNDAHWVRELLPEEMPQATHAKTGDHLPDGSVLLWRDDMNRMGLDQVRSWILTKVVQERAMVSIGNAPNLHSNVAPDEGH